MLYLVCNSMEMSRVQYLRTFVNERLTAAAEEILGAFEKTLVVYEEEIDRQRRMLDLVLKPEIKLHRAEPSQPCVSEEESPHDQQYCDQERNSSLDQEDPEPSEIKEEQEELCISQEGEQLLVQEEDDILKFTFTPTCEESDHSEDQCLHSDPYQTQSVVEKASQAISFKWIKSEADREGSGILEPDGDWQLLSHNCHIAESQHNKTYSCGNHGNAGSTWSTEPKQCDKTYKCNSCSKDFSQLTKLKTHMRIHTVKMPYKCSFCEKSFRHQCTRDEHVRTHTGEKPYTCNTCGTKFGRGADLNRHMRIHTGERPYTCNTCGKKFSRSATLKKHMRIHTGERPYTCNTCGKKMSSSSNLKKHMSIHTSENEFVDGSSFTTHFRVHTEQVSAAFYPQQ